MIEHVLDSFPATYTNHFVLIVQENFLHDYPLHMSKLLARGNVDFVVAKQVTQGAACSVLLARQFFRNSALLVADSDTFYEKEVIPTFLEQLTVVRPELGLITFKSDKPCYSYVKLSSDGLLSEIVEKQVVSEHAISGVYYFADGREFEDAAVEAMIYDDRVRGEFYLSKIFGNVAKKQKASLFLFDISANDMFCTGTPEQLQEVVRRLSK